MIQLQIVAGRKSGSWCVPNKLPVRIGRSSADDLVLEDDGVWEAHASIALTADGFFRLIARPESMVCVDGARVTDCRVKEGDVIELGGVKMVFHLAPARFKSLVVRESVLWAVLFALSIGELILMFWLG